MALLLLLLVLLFLALFLALLLSALSVGIVECWQLLFCQQWQQQPNWTTKQQWQTTEWSLSIQVSKDRTCCLVLCLCVLLPWLLVVGCSFECCIVVCVCSIVCSFFVCCVLLLQNRLLHHGSMMRNLLSKTKEGAFFDNRSFCHDLLISCCRGTLKFYLIGVLVINQMHETPKMSCS